MATFPARKEGFMPRSSSFEDLGFTISDPERLHEPPILKEYISSRLDHDAVRVLTQALLNWQPKLYARIRFPADTQFQRSEDGSTIEVRFMHDPRTFVIARDEFAKTQTQANLLDNGLQCEWDVRFSVDGSVVTAFPSVAIGFDLGMPEKELDGLLDALNYEKSIRLCTFSEKLDSYLPSGLPEQLQHLFGVNKTCFGSMSNVRQAREMLVRHFLRTPDKRYSVPVGPPIPSSHD
jgi:hypothetical protein